jgi:hypothetical protein
MTRKTPTKKFSIDELNSIGHASAKKYAQLQGISRQPHPAYSQLKHPKCSTPKCSKSKTVIDWHWTSGAPRYRPVCNDCHGIVTASRYAKKTGVSWVRDVADVVAHKAGYSSSTDYQNSIHPYRQHRKTYCENRDGRLGYKCRVKIRISAQLEVDHINGNPYDNRLQNLQTFCCLCHTYKTHANKDYSTPGRKTLKLLV